MNDIYTWAQDLYPLVKNRFDLRYNSRLNVIREIAGIVKQDEVDYKMEGLGGYGELPVYSDSTLAHADQKRGFITTITPVERALSVAVSYKKAKTDLSREAAKTGVRLADSAYMTVLNEFYRVFANAKTTNGADGVPWASAAHPISSDEGAETFSNLLTKELSVTAITEAQTHASSFVTPDGLAFAANYDLLLVSPELEGKAREICGPEARIMPALNPETGLGANPVYGMRYLVIGGGGSGLTGGQWAIADSMLLPEVLKLVYISEPTVLISPQDNPLITDYIGYVDFAFGFGDARPIVFSYPETGTEMG